MSNELKNVTVFDLGSNNLLLISKFVRLARIEENIDIKLNDENIICKVLDLGETTHNPKLTRLCKHLKVSIAKHLESKNAKVFSRTAKADSFKDIA